MHIAVMLKTIMTNVHDFYCLLSIKLDSVFVLFFRIWRDIDKIFRPATKSRQCLHGNSRVKPGKVSITGQNE